MLVAHIVENCISSTSFKCSFNIEKWGSKKIDSAPFLPCWLLKVCSKFTIFADGMGILDSLQVNPQHISHSEYHTQVICAGLKSVHFYSTIKMMSSCSS